jgi:PAS domain S-box-containing protein
MMLSTLLLTRCLFLLSAAGLNPTALQVSNFVMVFFTAVTYAIALFGFHIFDPIPAARLAVLEQMRAGMVVFDSRWRVVSLNLVAESLLGVRSAVARGQRWQELATAGRSLPDLSAPCFAVADPAPECTFDCDGNSRRYELALSPLHDFRGLRIGHLLLLRDVTEQRWAQAQRVEQQRALAALHERERLARELHDSIGQVLGYASFQVEAASQLIDDGQPASAAAQLMRLAAVLQDAHADLREQILNLRAAPPSPQEPLFATVHHYLDGFTHNYAIGTKLAIGEGLCDEMLASESQIQLFRILQEALSNARKHSSARCVEVTFAAKDDALRMCIADDGCGFAPGAAPGDGNHLGLHFMRERAAELGGSLQVESSPGTGTCVAVEIPRRER